MTKFLFAVVAYKIKNLKFGLMELVASGGDVLKSNLSFEASYLFCACQFAK